MSDKVHAVILVDSKDRRSGISKSNTDFHYFLVNGSGGNGRPISFEKRSRAKQYFIRLENIRIPVSFYSIASDNNTFTFDESTGNSDVTVTVSAGNYTIDELIAEVETQMDSGGTNDYTLTYDEITQKVTIASDGAGGNFSFDTAFTSTLLTPLGFLGTETITGASSVVATNVAFTNTRRYFKLLLDSMNSNNVYDTTGVKKVAVHIPINEVRNDFIFFKNDSGYKIKMPSMPSITDFRVKLLYHDNVEPDLNGLDWSFDIVFYEYNKGEMSNFKFGH